MTPESVNNLLKSAWDRVKNNTTNYTIDEACLLQNDYSISIIYKSSADSNES
jgi:hypothetical protein